jgi:hypothetical protein
MNRISTLSLIALIAVLFTLSVTTTHAASSTGIGNYPVSNDSTGSAFGSSLAKAWGFTAPSTAYKMEGVVVRLGNEDTSAATITYELHNDSSNKPGTTILTSGTLNLAAGSAVSDVSLAFDTPYSLTSGTSYWVVLKASSNLVKWAANYPAVNPSSTLGFTHKSYQFYSVDTWYASTYANSVKLIVHKSEVSVRADTIGVYLNGAWYLRNSNSAGAADITVSFGGDVTDLPVVGDWNADGIDTIGIFRASTGVFLLSDSNTSPTATYSLVFGNPSDTPFAGRWTIDMAGDGVGVYRPSNGILYQKKALTTGYSDFYAVFGNPGDQGFSGDWNSNYRDSIGVYRGSLNAWYLTNTSEPTGITYSNADFIWSIGSARALAGDWNGDNQNTVGYYTSAGVFVLHSTNSSSGTDTTFAFGPAGGYPVAGKWTATTSSPALVSGNGSSDLQNLIVPEGSSSGITNNTDDGRAD